jgi:hypothetical protein
MYQLRRLGLFIGDSRKKRVRQFIADPIHSRRRLPKLVGQTSANSAGELKFSTAVLPWARRITATAKSSDAPN